MSMIYIIMGVSGSGKTTVAKILSDNIKVPYFDADDFHSVENKAKMKAGIPLNDEDRVGWLQSINNIALSHMSLGGAIIACSALKEKYRLALIKNISAPIQWVVLKGGYSLIHDRMAARKDHYMPPGLLTSQLDTMEYPHYGLHISIDQSPQLIVDHILLNQDRSEFGLLGLGVMGKSLARNLAAKGIKLSLFNQFSKGKEEKVAERTIAEFSEFSKAKGFEDIREFITSLATPRKIFLMVPAGQTVDKVIGTMVPYLSPGDILMDGGNSHFKDTERRIIELWNHQIHFVGIGVSGGEKGALRGPAIMPGGHRDAYNQIEHILQAIAAKDKQGRPCSGYIGSGGAGHFVKMIHNGIEYAEMQLISEVYWLLKKGSGKSNEYIATLFEEWYGGELSSYLLEITIKILRHKTEGQYTLDKIVDIGGNKGTGGWSLTAAAEVGVPATLIGDALFARYISSYKQERTLFGKNKFAENVLVEMDTNQLKDAYTLARWINHHQGFEVINAASLQNNWALNLSETARIWTNGCIIRSSIMETICELFKTEHNILLHRRIEVQTHLPSLIKTVTSGLANGLALPCLSSALNFILGYATTNSPMNLIQAQRDFFGAHTYRTTDDPYGQSYHTDWEA